MTTTASDGNSYARVCIVMSHKWSMHTCHVRACVRIDDNGDAMGKGCARHIGTWLQICNWIWLSACVWLANNSNNERTRSVGMRCATKVNGFAARERETKRQYKRRIEWIVLNELNMSRARSRLRCNDSFFCIDYAFVCHLLVMCACAHILTAKPRCSQTNRRR